MKQIRLSHVVICVLTPFLCSGCLHEEIEACETPSNLTLWLELPSPHLPDYRKDIATRKQAGYDPRCVIEVFSEETGEKILHRNVAPTPVAGESGQYSVALTLDQGAYELRLWTDYVPWGTTTDYHYLTDNLATVGFNPARDYIACSDSRDAGYALHRVVVTENEQEERITLQRPLAKYRIVATDVERYYALMATKSYPPPGELTATLFYEGFLPSSFHVAKGAPNDAATGISYSHPLSAPATGSSETQLVSDWVLTDNNPSFVEATLRITDRQGHLISQVSGIRIDYLRGHLTTIRGSFLTAGNASGGITIDTTWDGEFIIEF